MVGPAGSGELSYQQAMAAIFIESWIFLILSVTGVRGGIVKYMPKCIAIASTVGIGLLLAFTGLRSLGVVVFDPSTLVSLGRWRSGSAAATTSVWGLYWVFTSLTSNACKQG